VDVRAVARVLLNGLAEGMRNHEKCLGAVDGEEGGSTFKLQASSHCEGVAAPPERTLRSSEVVGVMERDYLGSRTREHREVAREVHDVVRPRDDREPKLLEGDASYQSAMRLSEQGRAFRAPTAEIYRRGVGHNGGYVHSRDAGERGHLLDRIRAAAA
jgi:hypothetical protein